MAKEVLLVSRHESRSSYDTAESMRANLQAAAGIDTPIRYAATSYEDLLITYAAGELTIIDTVSGRDVREFDGLFLFGWYKDPMQQDMAYSLALYAQAYDVPCLNREAMSRSRTKLSQYVLAALHGVPITSFVFVQDAGKLPAAVASSELRYPMIVKSARGSKGANNHLVKSAAELQTIAQEAGDLNYVAQSFVPNDGDYRLLVMGNQVTMAMLRKAQEGTHLNNTSQGGSAANIPLETLDRHMLDDSVKVAGLVRREITGVDMIVHKETGEYFMLEVNNMPQLSTGSLVEDKMQALNQYLTAWVKA